MPGGTASVRARRVLVVANPLAGLKRGRPAGDAAAAGARRSGAQVTLHRTTGPGDATIAAAAAARDGFDLVLAAGGDGTVHEVANGLAGSGVALGVAPAGTMNLLARVLRVPLDPGLAAERVTGGSRRIAVRPGRANGRLFVVMASAGFDAWVLRELLAATRGKIRFRDYVRGALRGLLGFPFPRLEAASGGRVLEAHTVVVGRAPLYGGFLRPTPNVGLEDGLLELCALSGGRARLALTAPRLFSGAHAGRPGVALARVRAVRVTSERPGIPFQLDGELAGELPLTIDLADALLDVACPVAR